MKLPRPCKVCQRPMQLEVWDDVVAECEKNTVTKRDFLGWLNRLVPMATCNRCFDMIAGKKAVMDRIYEAAGKLISGVDSKEERAGIRLTLERETKRFSQIMAHYFQLENAFWDVEFVDQICEQPMKVKTILSSYEQLLRRQMKGVA